MGALTAWWHRVGYLLFPSHQKELDNINKIVIDLREKLVTSVTRERVLKDEMAASVMALDSMAKTLKTAREAYRRPEPPQKAKTAAEVRRLAEQAAQTEGEGDGV